MSEELPEHLRAKVLKRWLSEYRGSDRLAEERGADVEKIVADKIVDDRARELIDKVKRLYPDKYPLVLRVFHELLSRNVVRELDGYTVYTILNSIGLRVRPETRIKFVKRGREVDLKDYLES